MAKEQITKNDKIYLARFTNDRGILGVLAIENDEDINKILAENRNTPLEVLKNLSSNDIYKDALNENYSFKKYEELMNDEDFRKRQPIEQETIIKMFRVIDDKEDISNNLCKIFINVDYEPLLYKMASYEKTPPEILEELAKIKDDYLNLELAKNPNCPQNILEEFAKSVNYSLMLQVAENPNCPQNIIEEFAERASLVKNEFLNIRLAVNPNIPIEILEQLSKDESLKVKNIVLNNPSLTREIVENMSNDPNNGKELIGRCNEYLERLDKKEQSNDYDFER